MENDLNQPGIAMIPPAGPAGVAMVTTCPKCLAAVAPGALVCANCNSLVYVDALNACAGEAITMEATDRSRAAFIWRQCLDFLPAGSPQHEAVAQRAAALAVGLPVDAVAPPPPRPRNDPWPIAVGKTIVSMAISILVYSVLFGGGDFRRGLFTAAGFVILILVHEMGHVAAMWYYGLSASPPIFIPFVGALINLRESPPNAKVEAIVGIGGPVAGTLGTLVCLAMYLWVPALRDEDWLVPVIQMGFFLNLFNLFPVPPLDGGRITAAVSPWIWMAGLAGLVWMIISEWMHGRLGVMLIIVLMYAVPRVRVTLQARGRDNPYYRISRASSWTIGALYAGLAIALAILLIQTGGGHFLGLHSR